MKFTEATKFLIKSNNFSRMSENFDELNIKTIYCASGTKISNFSIKIQTNEDYQFNNLHAYTHLNKFLRCYYFIN